MITKTIEQPASCPYSYTKPSKAPRFNFRTDFKTMHQIAEIYVGPQEARFSVHRDLLTHHSPFFRAALTGGFTETASQVITLPEENLDSFELFVLWLYTQELDPMAYFKDQKPAYYVLLNLYALADRLCVEQLRNHTLDTIAQLADQTNSVLTPSDTHLLYDRVCDSAPLRRLILDLFAFKKTDKLLAEHCDLWHPTFLLDLVVKLKRPDPVAMQRHNMTMDLRKPAYRTSKGCSSCSDILPPTGALSGCMDCGKAYCTRCISTPKGLCAFEEGSNMCKPWKTSMKCKIYHEHLETAECLPKQ